MSRREMNREIVELVKEQMNDIGGTTSEYEENEDPTRTEALLHGVMFGLVGVIALLENIEELLGDGR